MLWILQTGRIRGPGEVAEWLNVAVSKTVVRVNVPRVRIPLSPQEELKCSIVLKERHFWMNKRKK